MSLSFLVFRARSWPWGALKGHRSAEADRPCNWQWSGRTEW